MSQSDGGFTGLTGDPSREPVRVAVIGLGWAARTIWLPRLRAHRAFSVTALGDPDPAARAAASAGRAERQLAHPAELSRHAVDLAIVAAPNHVHAAIAAPLLARGIPVFIEKPVCLDSSEAEELAAAERLGNAVLLAGSAARYRADVRALRHLIPRLGRIRHVDLAWTRARGVPEGWFTQQPLSGGGALVDLGWHLLDTLISLLGPVTFVDAVGATSRDFLRAGGSEAAWRGDTGHLAPAGEVEDTTRGFLVTGDGISVALQASWASHEPLDSTSIRIEGSAGTAELRCVFGFSPNREQGTELRLLTSGERARIPVAREPVGAEYDRQLDELPARLADRRVVGEAIAATSQIVGVIERIYRSASRLAVSA